jgi:hypothetical protein
MKQVAILLLAIMVWSCHKEKTGTHCNDIVGEWELRKSEGGIAGTIDYLPGNGYIFEFKSDGTYRQLSNGAVHETGNYTIQPSGINGQWKLTMTSSSSSGTVSIRFEAQHLVFLKAVDCCDYPDTTYARI